MTQLHNFFYETLHYTYTYYYYICALNYLKGVRKKTCVESTHISMEFNRFVGMPVLKRLHDPQSIYESLFYF